MLTYNDMLQFETFEERVNYLKTNSVIGEPTFEFDRWINQNFYLSQEWKQVRNKIIVRDAGRDLAMNDPNYEIIGPVYVHHINPLTKEQIANGDVGAMFDPQNLVTVSRNTHNMIHFGHILVNRYEVNERRPNDTVLWRKSEYGN